MFVPNLTTFPQQIPPHDLEAEKGILGAILLDPPIIHLVKGKLPIEAFYLETHQDIYRTALNLAKKNTETNLLTIANALQERNLLKRIGGRSTLVALLGETVSSCSIEGLIDLVLDKYLRRRIIQLGVELAERGNDPYLELGDLVSKVEHKSQEVIGNDFGLIDKTKDAIKRTHDRLIDQVKRLYTTIASPSERFFRMKMLGDRERLSPGFLEQMYLKSLANNCTKLLTYEELKSAAGSSVRKWLQQGLVPMATTILLAADGGIGKTKLIYSLGKALIQGSNLGHFQATGEKRRILFYQGDEQEGDMLQALQMLGYEENDISDHIRVRFGWSFESMSTLISDLQEFKPDFVVFDSLSFGSRFSNFREGDSEFARPILESTALASEYNATFLFIHHTNRAGDVRGTTAIRNAVSEVWRLRKDTRPEATSYDRILEIDKSRSRSSGKRYKLYFDPDTLGFNFLGEDSSPEDSDTMDKPAWDKILQFFHEHRNTRFTSEEIGHRLHISNGHSRRLLNAIASDGLLSVERKPGKPYLYFLEFTGGDTDKNDSSNNDINFLRIRGETHDQQMISSDDQQANLDIASNTAEADHLIIKIEKFSTPGEGFSGEKSRSDDQQSLEALPRLEPTADHVDDQAADHVVAVADHRLGGDQPVPKPEPKPEPKFVKTKHPSPVGEVCCIGESLDDGNTWELMWRYPIGKNKQKCESEFVGDEQEVRAKLKTRATSWVSSQRYKVTVGEEVIKGCKCIEMPEPRAHRHNYRFQTPDKRDIYISNPEYFEWQAPGES